MTTQSVQRLLEQAIRLALALATAVLIGTVFGLGGFTFVFARGHSYLSDDPAACANCHIMDEHFDAWAKSSHSAVAGCNDCHTPQDPSQTVVPGTARRGRIFEHRTDAALAKPGTLDPVVEEAAAEP